MTVNRPGRLALAALFVAGVGCTRKPPPAPVALPDPAARLVRPQTPDDLFGEPRPKLPAEVVKVLDALWARQLQVHRLEVRVSIEELDEAGNPRADKRPLTRYVAWDERYGYRLFATGEGFICDGKEHTDLSLGRKTPCPEGGFHAKVAPIFEAEPLGASRLEMLVRQPGTRIRTAFAFVDGVEASWAEDYFTLITGDTRGRTELTLGFNRDLAGTPISAERMDYLYAVSRARIISHQTISVDDFTEKDPGLWVAGILNTEHTQLDPISRKNVTTRFRQTLVDFIVNGPSNPALFLPGAKPPQPPTP